MIDIIEESKVEKINKIVDHTNTRCIFCGSTKTTRWIKHHNDKGGWDRKSYKCNACYRRIKKFGTPYIEDIKKERFKKYEVRKCCRCGSNKTYTNSRHIPGWIKDRDDNGDWTLEWICGLCYGNDYQKNNPNSQHNLRKDVANIRTGNSNIDGSHYKGLVGELTVCKTLGAKNRNIEDNNFRSYVDTFYHEKYGEIQIKTKCHNPDYNHWAVNVTGDSRFDTAIILCMDNDMKNIERVYVIPHDEIGSGITITRCGKKWEKFRIDETPFRNTYQNLLEFFKDKKFDIKNIKKWLEI